MAKMNSKGLSISVVMGVTCVLVAVGLFGIVNTAISQDTTVVQGSEGSDSADGAPPKATTIEGSDIAREAVTGGAVVTGEQKTDCKFHWVGRTAAGAEGAAKATGRPYRMLPPGSAMTMDYRADRINIELNKKNLVTKVTCG